MIGGFFNSDVILRMLQRSFEQFLEEVANVFSILKSSNFKYFMGMRCSFEFGILLDFVFVF